MPKQKEATLSFAKAPDIINIKQLSEMLGMSNRETAKLFNSKGFSLIFGTNGKKLAYKYDVAKFLGISYGINNVGANEEIIKVLNEILSELRKRNNIITKII